MAEFDRHAAGYEDTLDRCVAFTGGDSMVWARHKAAYLARLLGAGWTGKVLDYGCGVGLLSAALLDALPGCRVEGYDVSSASTDKISRSLKSRVRFTNDVAEVGRDYDLVVLANVLHHIPPPERAAVLKDLASRLKPGARLAVFEHNPYNPATRWIVAHCEFDEDAIILTSSEARRLLTEAGLKVSRGDYTAFFPGFLSRLWPAEAWLAWCPLGAQHATVAAR